MHSVAEGLPRSTSGSRNDLFSESWAPTLEPPKPLRLQMDDEDVPRRSVGGVWSSSLEVRLDLEESPEESPRLTFKRFKNATASSSASSPSPSMSKTSSFFDVSYAASPTPPDRRGPPPEPPSTRAPAPTPLQISNVKAKPAFTASPLSPLHYSPSLPSSSSFPSDWQPTLPVFEDVELRLRPSATYLLGEGRHAKVFLAGYSAKGKGRDDCPQWRLCAAKRLSADRESQTLGLREAFFLHRLRSELEEQPAKGEVFVVKLIAVKEDGEKPVAQGHSRSASDALVGTPLGTPSPLLAGLPSSGGLGVHPASRLRSSTVAATSSATGPMISDKHIPYSIPPSPLALPSVASTPSLPSLFLSSTEPSATSSRLVLLLEHCPLGSVDRMLRTSPTLVGAGLWLDWAKQAISALQWVHEHGIVHADVKPGNLLLTEDLRIRLSDFGSSLLVHPAHPPIDGIGLGTLPYSSPELLSTTKPFSFPTDIFSLGATLYQCITGREPYKGLRTVETMHHVRKGLFWAYEERERVSRIGSAADGRHRSSSASWQTPPYLSAAPTRSPSPSSSLQVNSNIGVRRAVSLRVPSSQPLTPANHHSLRPAMVRQPSAESIKASADLVGEGESPAGIKLWAIYTQSDPAHAGVGRDAIEALLGDDSSKICMYIRRTAHHTDLPAPVTPTRIRTADFPTVSTTAPSPLPETPTKPKARFPSAYDDGSPPMHYLAGDETVSEAIRKLLWSMVRPEPEERPSANDLLELL